jgi:hypothetical protein
MLNSSSGSSAKIEESLDLCRKARQRTAMVIAMWEHVRRRQRWHLGGVLGQELLWVHGCLLLRRWYGGAGDSGTCGDDSGVAGLHRCRAGSNDCNRELALGDSSSSASGGIGNVGGFLLGGDLLWFVLLAATGTSLGKCIELGVQINGSSRKVGLAVLLVARSSALVQVQAAVCRARELNVGEGENDGISADATEPLAAEATRGALWAAALQTRLAALLKREVSDHSRDVREEGGREYSRSLPSPKMAEATR